MAQLKRKRRPLPGMPEITLTPLIDTALTLLIIFIVTTPMIHNAIKVTLPKGSSKEDDGKMQELVVHIDSKKNIFVNGASVKQAELLKHLKQQLRPLHKTVYVKADESVAYGTVLSIVDEIKVVGGIEYVALAMRPT